MSERRVFEGFVQVAEAEHPGMITLRGAAETLEKMAKSLGCAVPNPLQVTSGKAGRLAWMSPDELMFFCKAGAAQETMAKVTKALGADHGMVVDVTDARAVFNVTGDLASDVIAKLCPFDRRGLMPGMIRRTRIGQVAGAVICEDGGYTVIGFRSVGDYLFELLSHAAKPGSALG